MTSARRPIRQLISIGIILALWQLLPSLGIVRSVFFPPASQVVATFVSMLMDGSLLNDSLTTIYRVCIAGIVGLISGVAVAIAMDSNRLARWLFSPLVAIMYPAPKMALVPIFVLWFGIDDASKILLAAFEAFFPIVVTSYAAAHAVNERLRWSAAALGAGRIRTIFKVVLPAILPDILAGFRIAYPLLIIVVVISEMTSSGGGLGNRLTVAGRNFQVTTQFSILFTLMIIGGVGSALLKALQEIIRRSK